VESNLAIIRHAVFNILEADTTKGSLRRKRLGACIDPELWSSLLATWRSSGPTPTDGYRPSESIRWVFALRTMP